MGISKTLVYPFSAHSQYYEGYAWAMELALRLNAKLQLFTTTPPESAEEVYQSLLAAHGYYLHHYRHDKVTLEKAVREQHISTGELRAELIKHLKSNSTDILIIDPAFHSEHSQDLKEILKESGAAIILTDATTVPEETADLNPSITDHFYNRLRSAEFYKVPESFFNLLGRDRSVFNYLRKIFQKNKSVR